MQQSKQKKARTSAERNIEMSYKELRREAEEARVRRAQDRKGRAVMFFWTNAERINALKRWYPYVYRLVLKSYPYIVENPDDYPPVAMNVFNSILETHIPMGDYNELCLV